MCPFQDDQSQGAVIPKRRTRTQKPKMFRVLLHNDDFTTIDFVIFILKTVFLKSTAEAAAITMKVHKGGVGIAGVYPYEIAIEKVADVTSRAKRRGFPLLCTAEAE